MDKNQELIRMSFPNDVRIINDFLRIVTKYFPGNQISGFYFATLHNDIPLFEFGDNDNKEYKKLCFQKILNTTKDKLIIDHTVHPGSFGVYFTGFGEPIDEVIEVILGHYFFYRYVLETDEILEKIWAIKGFGKNQPIGQLAFKFLHEHNENE